MTEKTLKKARNYLAGFLKNRRIELGMSQNELAEKTGLSFATINRMENAHFWLNMKHYLIICEALHLFPAIAEMESNTPIAEALRQNWKPNPKAMSVEDALKLKGKRYNRDGSLN